MFSKIVVIVPHFFLGVAAKNKIKYMCYYSAFANLLSITCFLRLL